MSTSSAVWKLLAFIFIISYKGDQIEEVVYLKCSGIQIKQIPNPVVELYTRNNFLLDFGLWSTVHIFTTFKARVKIQILKTNLQYVCVCVCVLPANFCLILSCRSKGTLVSLASQLKAHARGIGYIYTLGVLPTISFRLT